MGSTTVQIDGGSHAIAVSQPDRVRTAAIIIEGVLARLAPVRAAAAGWRTSGTKVIQRVLPVGQEGTAADRAFPEE
jgi:hypothetical protein